MGTMLSNKIGGVVWNSMVDWPGTLCTTLFFKRCPFRCEYCHNAKLENEETMDENIIFEKILKRKDIINHVVLSGGESTFLIGDNSKALISFLRKLCMNNIRIGLHTNGYNSSTIRELIDTTCVDFIAMDIKSSKKRYLETVDWSKSEKNLHREIQKSIRHIIDDVPEYEFRTTVYPKHVNIFDCIKIAFMLRLMGSKGTYYIQQFDDSNIDTDVKPYSKNYIRKIGKVCNLITKCRVRGI